MYSCDSTRQIQEKKIFTKHPEAFSSTTPISLQYTVREQGLSPNNIVSCIWPLGQIDFQWIHANYTCNGGEHEWTVSADCPHLHSIKKRECRALWMSEGLTIIATPP